MEDWGVSDWDVVATLLLKRSPMKAISGASAAGRVKLAHHCDQVHLVRYDE